MEIGGGGGGLYCSLVLYMVLVHRASKPSKSSKLLSSTATLTHILYSLMGGGLVTKRAFLRPHKYMHALWQIVNFHQNRIGVYSKYLTSLAFSTAKKNIR